MNDVAQNYQKVLESIAQCAKKAGRDPKEITLVSVSKTVPVERISLALEAGATVLGENRVQEICEKYDKFDKKYKIFWHLIGQLQKNKVKYIMDKVEMIHSLDRFSLAQEIERQCERQGISYKDCLIQVNVSKENTKSGIYVEDVMELVEQVQKLSRVHIRGLMTIAPFTEDESVIRSSFSGLRKLFDRLSEFRTDNFQMDYLSMGMSGDYQIAIEEGANIVRIGSAIFGKRNYL